MTSPLKIGYVTLGCSKNTIDTEMMLAHLDNASYEITGVAEEADVVIINTCGFILDAKEESIQAIQYIAKLKHSGCLKKLIVTGCLAERWREKMLEILPEVDVVIGLGEIHRIAEVVKEAFETEKTVSFPDYEKTPIEGERMLSGDSTSVFLRVSEGCNSRCSYCAIPNFRGKYRSRTIESIVEEAQDLESAGALELNIIAQDIACYGIDLYKKVMLPELLKRLVAETTIPWIRLFYCYPDRISDDLIQVMKENPRILPYIDIPIQHINDTVLKRMNRHTSRKQIESVISKLRQEIPEIVIRTTAIVGFPDESEEQFEELLDFVKTIKFNRFGAFAYSREEDTPAYNFPNQIAEDVKKERLDKIMTAQAKVSFECQQACLDKVYDVLCEGYDEDEDMYFGRNYANGIDVDGKVYFTSDERINAGEFVYVKITDIDTYDLYGEVAE